MTIPIIVYVDRVIKVYYIFSLYTHMSKQYNVSTDIMFSWCIPSGVPLWEGRDLPTCNIKTGNLLANISDFMQVRYVFEDSPSCTDLQSVFSSEISTVFMHISMKELRTCIQMVPPDVINEATHRIKSFIYTWSS